jgi:hypothetical protein
MKRISILSAFCLVALTQIVSARLQIELPSENAGIVNPHPIGDPSGAIHTQFLSFNDNNGVPDAGTYNPNDNFSFDIFLTFSGYNSTGLSFWLETTADAAPNIVLTGYVRGTTFPSGGAHIFPMPFTVFESNGWYTTPNPSNLGATLPGGENPVPPGTYFLETLSVSLTGLAPGTYILRSTALNPRASEVTSFDGTTFADNNLPNTTYTITIVPEPSTAVLLIVAAIGAAAPLCRRRHFAMAPERKNT